MTTLKEAARRTQGDILGLLVVAALVLLAYYPVSFGGKTFDSSSLVAGVNGAAPPTGLSVPAIVDGVRPDRAAGAWQTTPWARIIHRDLTQGEWPLWNPYEGTGMPLAGNAQSAAFDPLLLAVFLHPTQRMWDLTYLFIFVLGGAATYLLLRCMGCGTIAGLAAGGSFALCGYFVMDSSDGFVHLYVYLPLLVLAIERIATTQRWRWIPLAAVASAGSILAGMPEATLFVLLAAGAYALFRLFRAAAGARIALAFLFGLAATLGLLLASPLLLLLAQFVPVSFSAHSSITGARTGATSALLFWIMPYANGYPAMPRLAGIPVDRGWCGAAVATLGAVAASVPSAMRRAGGWFFLGAAAVVLAKDHDIVIMRSIGSFPLLDRVDFIAFAPPVAAFGLAVLAGIGVHVLERGELRASRVSMSLSAFGAGVVFLLFANHRVLAAGQSALAYRSYLLTTLGVAAVVAAVVLVLRMGSDARVRQGAAVAVTAAALLELFLLIPQNIYAPRGDPYQAPAWLTMLQRDASTAPGSRVFGFDYLLYPDIAGVFGLQDIRTVNGLYVKRYATYINDFLFPFLDRFTGDGMIAQAVQANPMFNLLGVRFVVTTEKELDIGAGAGQYTVAGSAGGVRIYQNNASLPRAFVVASVQPEPDLAGAVAYVKAQAVGGAAGIADAVNFDPSSEAVVEFGPGQPNPFPAPRPGGGTTATVRPARVVSYGAQRVVVNVPAGPPGLLVLTDSYFPGWRVTVNGAAQSILPTDVAFRGVILGSRPATVVFTYHSPGGDLGWILPILGLFGCGAALVVDRPDRGIARPGYSGPTVTPGKHAAPARHWALSTWIRSRAR